jgi:dipeptidyl aminopeptidase/acylaminoacyl peptidase
MIVMIHARTPIAVALAAVCGISLILSCAPTTSVSQPELIPREVLFGNPDKESPQLSPDGTMMSYLASVDDVLNVWVGTIGADDVRPVTQDTVRGIRSYFWAADNRHIMYLQDKGGDENWRLYAVNLETEEIRDLTPFEGVQTQIVDRSKHHPNELLIAMNKENPQVHDVYHLDLTTAELKLVAKNPGNIMAWMTDPEFKVRGNLTATPGGGYDLMVRAHESADWTQVARWDSDNAVLSGPISFTQDGRSMYLVDSRNANASRLVLLDLTTGEIDVLAEDPQYDVGGVMINPDTYIIEAVTFAKDRDQVVVLDESIRGDVEAIQALHPGDFIVVSRDDANATWLVGFTIDDGPIPYYSFDRATAEATFLFDHRPDLNQYTLAKMEPVTFEARDGLTIHGYLTFPPGLGRSDLPMVLNVHGGPWYRDQWGYNSEAQWFANRGYICFQVNFRGSTGYGKEFLNAGDREWAGKMHDDLVDAVQWAVAQGYADSDRVAIYGGSYGGYATLVAATFTPDLFRCGVDMVGPSNLITLINSIPPYWSAMLEIFHKRIGHPEKDKEFLESRSPLFKADQIRMPLLIAQGANDPRVKQAEADQIVEALKAHGLDYEYLLFEDEGHGLLRPENRLEFYAATEKFLATHLGGRFEAASRPAP